VCLLVVTAGSADARDQWRRPDVIVGALGVHGGERVADVGCGDGYLTFKIAAVVGARGTVVATDIDPRAVAHVAMHGDPGVVVRLVEPADPGLEPGAYDAILLAEVDHLLPDRVAFLRRLGAALAPGGRIVVENRLPFRAALMAAAEAAGLHVVAEPAIEGQFVVVLK
jgi:SAM-dependent methyltransferase